MKTVEQLAREAGLVLFEDSEGHCVGVTDEQLIPEAVYHNDERLNKLLAPFAAAVIAQYRESLLAGVGEPVITKNTNGITLHTGWDDVPINTKLYTADQLAAAVAIEREKAAKAVENYCGAWDDQGHALAAAIRGRR